MGGRGVVVVVVTALLAATLLVACGGGESALGARDFRREANRECRRLQRAGDELRVLSQPDVRGKEVRRHVERAVGILRRRLRTIDDLVPPDGVADAVSRMVSTLERYADGLAALGARAGPDDTFATLQAGHPKQVQRLNALTSEANALAARTQLLECIAGAP